MNPTPAQLLGRPEQPVYDQAAKDMIAGKRVLVTGAGGSIGSELCRQVNRLNPSDLFMLDRDESLLQAIQLDIQGDGLLSDEHVILADIREETTMFKVFQRVRPDIVFHAAALKHLPALERFPTEGVRTNILGTRNVLRAAYEAKVQRFVNISTDKAADPTSVLGATKRVAEILVELYDSTDMTLASVRFGNVLGSRGSFLPLLVDRINQGKPVTITDKDAERFFMTIPEAAGLVIEAGTLANDGETFVLDMGKPVKILDLVNRYVEFAGVEPPEIIFTGLRPGEKLSEVVFAEGEQPSPTSMAGVYLAPPAAVPGNFVVGFQALEGAAEHTNREQTLDALEQLLPNYQAFEHRPLDKEDEDH